MMRDFLLEIIPDESGSIPWPEVLETLEVGYFTGLKVRDPNVPWKEIVRRLKGDSPLLIMRSKTEVPDGFELRRLINSMLPGAKLAGFKRFQVLCSNEVNNIQSLNLELWQQIRESYSTDWSAAAEAYPAVHFVSPTMKPMSDLYTAAKWHTGTCFVWPSPKGAHVYCAGLANLFWEPAHVRNLIGGPIAVLEFNQNEEFHGDRTAENIKTLDYILKNCPEIESITYFCAPNTHSKFQSFGIGLEESRTLGTWAKNKIGGIMPDGGLQRLDFLRTTYPGQWTSWANAGGTVAQSFELYLVANGDLPAGWEHLRLALNKGGSAATEAENILGRLNP